VPDLWDGAAAPRIAADMARWLAQGASTAASAMPTRVER
jgi:hypothetical protein